MFEPGDGLRFSKKATQLRSIGAMQHLDGNFALQSLVISPVDRPHRPLAKDVQYPAFADYFAVTKNNRLLIEVLLRHGVVPVNLECNPINAFICKVEK